MKEILMIRPKTFGNKILSEEEILHLFNICNAFWMHDGDPQKPHAELTSGLCSNGYFNCSEILKHTNLCEILAWQLVRKLRQKGIKKVDWVIGSPYAAITFSYAVAKGLSAIHGFAEKDTGDPKKMLWARMTIPKDSKVLQAEELVTTSFTFREVRRAIIEGNSENVNFLPIVGTLVHRPPKLPVDYEIDGKKIEIVSLIEKEIWAVSSSECPLCKAGSPRYRPKTHWKELTEKI